MKHLKCITINTDASYHPEHNVGGYAFYVVCDLFKMQKSGKFKSLIKNSIEAEMMCIANAIHTVLAQKELPSCDLIIVNCDCLHAFQQITLKSKNEVGRKVAQLMRKLRNKMAFRGAVLPSFEFRHVKAHSGVKDSRSYVNEWCDKEAKKWMRVALKEISNC